MPDFVAQHDLKIHYLDFGSPGQDVVVLLHGLGATGDSWGLQFPALREVGFRVIAPDMRGFGKSGCPGGSLTIRTMARDVIDLLSHLGIRQAHIVGISMGGTIALQLALDAPESVENLVLINTFASLRPDNPRVWLYFGLRFMLIHTLGLETQARAVAHRIFPHPDQEPLRLILLDQICQADLKGW
jgi:3-oxoadipate enol-lactonase